MKKTSLLTSAFVALMALAAIGCTKSKGTGDPTGESESKASADATADAADDAWGDDEVLPVLAVCVKGQPLFAPFNDGDIAGGGQVLRQSPDKYTQFILGEEAYGITYQKEKNPQLKEDSSYLNQYLLQTADGMKGQLYAYTDPSAIEHYMMTHGDVMPEGDFIPMEYACGVAVGADYLKNRSIVSFYATTTEDPDAPQFSKEVVAAVEKALGAKVEKNRVSHIIGDKEYDFGVMRTKPNDKYGVAAWVLAKGSDITIWTDTCEVVAEEHRIYWSSIDPDEYMEPSIIAVTKGRDGLDIYCSYSPSDETDSYMLMRQKRSSFKKLDLGSFYLMYE